MADCVSPWKGVEMETGKYTFWRYWEIGPPEIEIITKPKNIRDRRRIHAEIEERRQFARELRVREI